MKIIGVSFFLGIAATIILSVTLFSIAIYDTAYHRIHNIIKYLFFILIGILLIIFSLLFTVTGGTDILLVLRDIDIYYLENLNSSNYDKQDFEKEIEWNFDVKD